MDVVRSRKVSVMSVVFTAALIAGCSSEKDTEAFKNDAGDSVGGIDDTAGTESASSADAGDASGDGSNDGSGDPKLDALAGEDAGDAGGETGGECNRTLTATIRDFSSSHPDFEFALGAETGIVESELGADGLPVYAGNPTTATTNGEANFNMWYRTVAENIEFTREIELAEIEPGVFGYDSTAFFPIDDEGFGNEFQTHNYHFTLEMRTEFTYQGGEIFYFRGDDDLFVFVNGKLGIDLGGVHGPLEGEIDMDARASELGITVGETYDLDFFFAERHTSESNFRIETTIECLETPPVG